MREDAPGQGSASAPTVPGPFQDQDHQDEAAGAPPGLTCWTLGGSKARWPGSLGHAQIPPHLLTQTVRAEQPSLQLEEQM